MQQLQKDMTSGSPTKIILNFTFPIFIGNVFQQFYNMADTVIVGKFVGTKALAAVGSTGTIMFLIYGFVTGMTAGFSTNRTEIWRGRYESNEADGRWCCCVDNDCDDYIDDAGTVVYEAIADIYENTVGYFSGCLCLYYDHLCRNCGTDVIQFDGKYSKSTGK